MSSELYWVAATALITALMWVPYILSLLGEFGVMAALSDGNAGTTPGAVWAQRAKRAHANAVENLVIFAPLAIGIHVAGLSSGTTATACVVFFFARLVHYLVYTAGIPFVRTLSFAIGWLCQIVLALALLGGA
ncbi:MAG TPA: MAPEG family protein [Thermohalobaculum sp.]|nr:MAPEG family protein [Thermohalobaculum sp.]